MAKETISGLHSFALRLSNAIRFNRRLLASDEFSNPPEKFFVAKRHEWPLIYRLVKDYKIERADHGQGYRRIMFLECGHRSRLENSLAVEKIVPKLVGRTRCRLCELESFSYFGTTLRIKNVER